MRNAKSEERTLVLRIPKTGRKEWIGLTTLAVSCILYSLAITAPPGFADIGSMLAGVLVALAVCGDRLGWVRLLILGAAAFGTASVLGSLGPGLRMAIGSRPFQTMAAAIIAPCALFLLHIMFADSDDRTLAISVWTFGFTLGGAIGQPLGSLMLGDFRQASSYL